MRPETFGFFHVPHRGQIRRGEGKKAGERRRDSMLQAELRIFQKLRQASDPGVRQGQIIKYLVCHLSLSPVTSSLIQQIFIGHTPCAKHRLETDELTAG